jgi:UDP-N-acetyl-D-galactosamine dehydrogenase
LSSRVNERIAVIGLGYVGLPVALAFAKVAERVVGFDISEERVAALRTGFDATGEAEADALAATTLVFSSDPADLDGASFFVVTVPTPIDREHRPDLGPLRAACRMIGPHLRPGAVVVFESTVYPGTTQEVCGPELSHASGLIAGRDFFLGYSPERINPGAREHSLDRVVKIVAGEDAATLERVAAAYGAIVPAGLHRAPSIAVAEAAKLIENVQRDLNIALMNELSLIFERLGLRTEDVLTAARTKWNFLRFSPGLVGGHCIGIDPYYLTAKAEAHGYHPDVILAGRRINDGMGRFIAQKTVKMLAKAGITVAGARVGVLGITFKEDIPDLRNSRVVDIIDELRSFSIEPLVHDPKAAPEAVRQEYAVALSPLAAFSGLDALILAVGHAAYRDDARSLAAMLKPGGLFIDVKSLFEPAALRGDIRYWSL